MLSLFLSGEWLAGDPERERDLSFLSSERERSLQGGNFAMMTGNCVKLINLPRSWFSLWLVRCIASASVSDVSVGRFATAAIWVACTWARLLRIAGSRTRLLLNWRLGATSARLRTAARWTTWTWSKMMYSIPTTQHCVRSHNLPRATTIWTRTTATRRGAGSATAASSTSTSAIATLILHQTNATSIQFRIIQLLDCRFHIRSRGKLNNPENRWRAFKQH